MNKKTRSLWASINIKRSDKNIVGIISKGEYVFHDVEGMSPAQIDMKNDGVLPTVTPDKPFDAILKGSNGDIVPQDSNFVKSKFFDTLYWRV